MFYHQTSLSSNEEEPLLTGETDEGDRDDAGDIIRAGASLAGSLLALFGQKVKTFFIEKYFAINLDNSRLDLSPTFLAIRCCMLYILLYYIGTTWIARLISFHDQDYKKIFKFYGLHAKPIHH